LRVTEIVNLSWSDVLPRDLGKGEKPRRVVLPEIVSRSLLTLPGNTGVNAPVFAGR
jgi:integrase